MLVGHMKDLQLKLETEEGEEHQRRVERFHWLQWKLWDGKPVSHVEIGRTRGFTKQGSCNMIMAALERVRKEWGTD